MLLCEIQSAQEQQFSFKETPNNLFLLLNKMLKIHRFTKSLKIIEFDNKN